MAGLFRTVADYSAKSKHTMSSMSKNGAEYVLQASFALVFGPTVTGETRIMRS